MQLLAILSEEQILAGQADSAGRQILKLMVRELLACSAGCAGVLPRLGVENNPSLSSPSVSMSGLTPSPSLSLSASSTTSFPFACAVLRADERRVSTLLANAFLFSGSFFFAELPAKGTTRALIGLGAMIPE